ncbi:agmatinase [Natronomonas pharaonis DSM 2160]|uniref:Agmatinase n=1 Tax=Natronomonas pharaonis (strain ATCC 35678 / DSM 2160 / CIP 103997 / JCM 8858 / NBRC 14720 / NCIMB 2260 / Gabara) TaxID=348780 RepID=A0A1U7EZM7_NATPD|nr:arginase family protein [Natronomonas pharaonis]CCI69574.1 agmatinase [Natronomonas pharaonis DSM 2160]
MGGFPGANASREAADYAVVGAPLDVSTTFQPGTRFGPDQVRRFARPFDDYDHRTGRRFSDLVCDAGDVAAWDDAADYLQFLDGQLTDHHRDGRVPLLLGGEHTVTVAGLRAADPDVYVCLDAHLDLYESYAGNDLAHATVAHHALDIADEAILLGVRTGSEAEWDRAAESDVTVVEPEAVAGWTPDFDGEAYFSVDIDAADPAYAPGTGTPVPFGLEPRTMRSVVRAVAPQAVGFDVVEVNDRDDGQAASLAGKLLQEFVFAHADG